MLCPEVFNFPPPKVMSSSKDCKNLEPVIETLKMNNFYKSVIITCPDEFNVPSSIQEDLLEDNDYYRLSRCSLTEFLEPTFTENFVMNGNLYCLSVNTNCIVQNCAAITPNGVLTLHVLQFIYQTVGLEGKKQKNGFYEINIDLKNLRHVDKLKSSLSKLEKFDFEIIWEPDNKDICPSSIAKYFVDRGISVSLCSLIVKKINPSVSEIATLEGVDIEEMVEWVGMLAHNVDTESVDTYISTYSQPECNNPIESNRMSVIIVKGMFTPKILEKVCQRTLEYVSTRELDHYWTSVSVQSCEHCPWRWNISTPTAFQAHDLSYNIFISNSGHKIYSVGQLKYT